MTPEQDAFAEHDERLIRMMGQVHASSLLQLEGLKARLSHNEKLVALCAGILAISFTATTTFPGSHLQEAATHSLLRSWQLFLLAIVFGVLANWLGITGMANFANSAYMKQVGVYFDMLHVSLFKLDPEYAKQERESWDRHVAKMGHVAKVSDIYIRLGGVIGVLAQVFAFSAFVSLYFFARAALASR